MSDEDKVEVLVESRVDDVASGAAKSAKVRRRKRPRRWRDRIQTGSSQRPRHQTIWLSPVFQSPMKDFGYDIENFIAIDKLFGTLDDFKDLMREVKKRGEASLIMDLCRTIRAIAIEWFINSTNASEECPEYADYYVWHEGHPRWTVDRNGTTIKAPPNNW
ncbi:putative Maltase A3 [Hypsibius exemplaris]|uniref:alpha-glucosidase n=1 Tax=Hypsibius exemplaris TaxID=2072580 RepID=A0A1W0WXG6_HYPEX|nr:putative Maltase A3 [Hypsibius exemplaris]